MTDLVGRRAERDSVDDLLTAAQAGRSGVLVVRGEAGIGKSAVLDYARDAATVAGLQVAQAVGVESEKQFAFAGLHQLCAPLMDGAGALPGPQQEALGVALGLRAGEPPDGFLVALATLNLMSEAAGGGPLLCLVDDVQWLDQASAQVLAFVARRVAAEPVALVLARRDPGEGEVDPFAGLRELPLGRLTDAEARTLLAAAVRTPMDQGVRDRVVAEAQGNPLALLELPRGAQPHRLAGGFALPGALSVPHRVEEEFRRRSGSLPADTQLLLLVAAAEPTGDQALLWRAVDRLGIDREAASRAEVAGLVEIGPLVRFRHSLARSAVYRAANAADRRRAHGALAAATDPGLHPDRHAWHRAQAVLGPDEDVAAELERSAGRARARGGLAAAAAFLQQAAELTPGAGQRAGRALEAAYAKHEAGASEAAGELVEQAAAGPLDELQQARLELLRAQIAFLLTRGSDVPGLLLGAAQRLAPLDPSIARETYLQALDTATITGGRGRRAREVAEAALAAPPPPGEPRPADLLLDGLVTTFTQGYDAGVPTLRRAVAGFVDEEPRGRLGGEEEEDGRWLWLAGRTALALFDNEQLYVLAERNVRLAREAGALATLPIALLFRAATLVLSGEVAQATDLAAEGRLLTEAVGAVPLHQADLVLAAWRGDRAETLALHAASVQAHGHGGAEVTLAHYALSVLHNGLGSYSAALDAAERVLESDELPLISLALPEAVEAASRAGQPGRAAAALEELRARADATGTTWARGLVARSRALTSTGAAADDGYREAIQLLDGCGMASHLARTHLVYGEWLRREGRRQDARDQLGTAYELLSDMGGEAFAERAARELRATGARPRGRSTQPTDVLTAHELHVARLVATGATSREVGAQLFLSHRTIDAHLRNIFQKLGIASRRQLRELPLP